MRFLIFLLFPIILSAQNIEELQQQALRQAKAVEEQFRANDKTDIVQRIRAAEALFEQVGNRRRMLEFRYQKMGLYYERVGERIKALQHYRRYLLELELAGLEEDNPFFYIDISRVYYDFGMFDLAKKYNKLAEQYSLTKGNMNALGTVYSNYSLFFKGQIGRLPYAKDSALYYAKRAFDTKTIHAKDSFIFAYQHFILGEASEPEQAKTHFRTVLHIFENMPDSLAAAKHELGKVWGFAYPLLADSYRRQNNLDSANYFIRRFWEMGMNRKGTPFILSAYTKEAKLRAQENNGKALLDLSEKISAQLETVPPSRYWVTRKDMMQVLAELFRQLGDSENAQKYGYAYYVAQDSAEGGNQQEQMMLLNDLVLQMENESTIQQQEQALKVQNEKLEADRKAQQVLVFIVVTVSTILVLMVALWWLVRRQKATVQAYSNELAAANSTKELLLSVLSHDLRSPFQSLIALSQAPNQATASDLAQRLHATNESARTVYAMLDNVLRWVTLQKGELQVQKSVFSLQQHCRQLLRVYQAQAAQQRVQIRQVWAFDPWVETDADLLQVVLRNIISNALRHSTDGQISFSVQEQTGRCLLHIRDTGGGLPEAVLQQLAQHGADYGAVARRGRGLGLLLVVQFLQQLGLPYRFVNEAGGTCFELSLPLLRSTSAAEETAEAQPIDTITLSAEEQQLLAPFALRLQALEIFETTDLYRILQEIPETSAAVVAWKQALRQSIQAGDWQAMEVCLAQTR